MISYEGRNAYTVNLLKTIYFDHPDWTICHVALLPATWLKYGRDLEEIVLAHPRIFPGYQRQETAALGFSSDPLYHRGRHADCWGTVWDNVEEGLSSMPVQFPLTGWSTFEEYEPPDPMQDDLLGPRADWGEVQRHLDDARRRGDLAAGGGLPHGFMYMRLFYLRGFDNLMMDMATDAPRLGRLIAMVEAYNTAVVSKYLQLGAEYMSFGDDLGLQNALPISPTMWRKFIKPSYMRILSGCRDADVPVYLHTDGHVLEIIGDLIEAGVRVLNPQIRANGLPGLQQTARGKVAINLDLDRQLFPFATPSQVADHIAEVFEGLYLPEGGLMLIAECEPDVPLANIEAICIVLEDLCHPPQP